MMLCICRSISWRTGRECAVSCSSAWSNHGPSLRQDLVSCLEINNVQRLCSNLSSPAHRLSMGSGTLARHAQMYHTSETFWPSMLYEKSFIYPSTRCGGGWSLSFPLIPAPETTSSELSQQRKGILTWPRSFLEAFRRVYLIHGKTLILPLIVCVRLVSSAQFVCYSPTTFVKPLSISQA